MSEDSVTYDAGECEVQVDGVREPLVVEGVIVSHGYRTDDGYLLEVARAPETHLDKWRDAWMFIPNGYRVRLTIEWLD